MRESRAKSLLPKSFCLGILYPMFAYSVNLVFDGMLDKIWLLFAQQNINGQGQLWRIKK